MDKKRAAMSHNYLKGLKIFVSELLHSPAKIGAVVPSSNMLARRIADQIHYTDNAHVLEIGAGTGVITQAMLERDIPLTSIIIVEQSAKMTNFLNQRFPGITVLQTNAINLTKVIEPTQYSINTIVSSLPLRSMPKDTVTEIIQQIKTVLPKNGRYIQFTYSTLHKNDFLTHDFHYIHSQYVWWNLPPARIDVYTHKD